MSPAQPRQSAGRPQYLTQIYFHCTEQPAPWRCVSCRYQDSLTSLSLKAAGIFWAGGAAQGGSEGQLPWSLVPCPQDRQALFGQQQPSGFLSGIGGWLHESLPQFTQVSYSPDNEIVYNIQLARGNHPSPVQNRTGNILVTCKETSVLVAYFGTCSREHVVQPCAVLCSVVQVGSESLQPRKMIFNASG